MKTPIELIAEQAVKLRQVCTEVPFETKAIDQANLEPGDIALMPFGVRGELSQDYAEQRGKAFAALLARSKGGRIVLTIPGYDDDPRELWDIEEVRNYVQQFAIAAGIRHAALLLPVIGESGVALLMACGVPAPGVRLVVNPKKA